jgi:hypothetical protein
MAAGAILRASPYSMHCKMNFSKPILIVLALLLLCCSGCSRVTLGYRYGDWLLRYWINDYTAFTPQQKEEIRLDVADYMRWHRQYALPEYTAFLLQVQALVTRDGALSPADVSRTKAELGRLYQLTMTPFVRPAAHLLSQLDERQIAELHRTLAEQNRELREEILAGDRQEQLAQRAQNHIKFTEALVGDLSDAQARTLREMSLRIPFVTSVYIEQREAKRAGLLALLEQHANEAQIAAYFAQWMDTLQFPSSAQQQQAFPTYDSAMNDMIVRIFELLNAQQKAQLRKNLSAYIADLQKLHALIETGGTAP